MITTPLKEICNLTGTFNDTVSSQAYQKARTKDIKEIKHLLKENPNAEIMYGNGWVRIAGFIFNGISESFLKNIRN